MATASKIEDERRQNLSREAQFLLLSASVANEADRVAHARALAADGLDWALIARIAPRQAMMPLAYRFANAVAGGGSEASALMRREFQGNALRNMQVVRELERLLVALERRGITPIVLKGPALAVRAYGHLAMRQFTDLDLLVPEHDASAAIAALNEAGYDALYRHTAQRAGRSSVFEATLRNPAALCDVDLHWRLNASHFAPAPEGAALWDRSAEIDFGVRRARCLSVEDELLYLCAHGAKHGWQTISGIADLAHLIAGWAVDWDAIVARADAAEGRRTLLLGVLMANRLLDAAVPKEIVAEAARDPAVTLASTIFRRYFAALSGERPGLYQRWTIPALMADGWRARLRYAAGRTFVPTEDDEGFMRLPRALFALYYVIRPLRLAASRAPQLFERRPSEPAGDDARGGGRGHR